LQGILIASEISAAIAEAEAQEAGSYAAVFSAKSSHLDDGWALLASIFSLHERLSDTDQPFRPMRTMSDGRRSFLPKDLADDQLIWLRELEAEINDPEFCARLSDIIWLCARDGKLAARAVSYYLQAAFALEDLEHWTVSVDRYTRAYRLATQLGRKSPLRAKVLDFLKSRLRTVKGDDPRWWSLKLMTLLYEAREDDHAELIGYAETAAHKAAAASEFRRQRDYLEFIAKLHHRYQNADAEEDVRVAIARSYKKEAEAADATGGGMKAHHHWECAVRAYRERPSLRGEVQELKSRLAAAGRDMLETMQSHSHSTDISDIIAAIRKEFCGLDTDAALYKFVSFGLTKNADIKAKAEESKGTFLASMFNSRVLDYEGRTVANVPGALSSDDPGYEERIKFDIQSSMTIRRDFAVQAQIICAFRILTDEHSFDAEYLSSIVKDSSFIPDGRLEHFCEGLTLGFNQNFSHAAHILVPQFEAGLREIASKLGLSGRNLSSSGVEDAWGLDRLLTEQTVVSHLGDDLVFELKSLLIEEFGPKFRHNLCHGLIPLQALNGADSIYAWWLFLRLCVFPTPGYHAFLREGIA
jgi:hypothetical protein